MEETTDIGEYLVALRRRWVLLVAGLVLGAVVGRFLLGSGQGDWLATADVLVNPPAIESGTVRPDQVIDMDTERQIAASESVAERAADRTDLVDAETLDEDAGVEIVADTQVLRVGMFATTPDVAVAGAEAIAEAYLDARSDLLDTTRQSNLDRVDEELSAQTAALESANEVLAGLESAERSRDEALRRYASEVAAAQVQAQLAIADLANDELAGAASDAVEVPEPPILPLPPDPSEVAAARTEVTVLTAEVLRLQERREGLDTGGPVPGSVLSVAEAERTVSGGLPSSTVAGAVLGLGLAAALALTLARFSRVVDDDRDLEALLDGAVLGSVPSSAIALPIGTEPLVDVEAAAFRRVATALAVRRTDDALTIAVTSVDGAPSRAGVSIRLTQALAEAGHRVVVIAGDRGIAAVDTAFGTVGEAGLQQVVTGNEAGFVSVGPGIRVLPSGAAAADIPVPAGSGFDDPDLAGLVVPGGPIAPPQPHRVAAVLGAATSWAEFVIVDTPQVDDGADLSVWASAVDGVLVVAGEGRTTVDDVALLRRELSLVTATTLGVVTVRGVTSRRPVA